MDARKVDEIHVALIGEAHAPHVLLHGHARIVRHLLAEPGQTVEERRLARVGGPNQRDEGSDALVVQDRRGGVTFAV